MRRKMFLVSVILLTVMVVRSAHADMAPPYQAPGSNISPEGQTQVQMVKETVVVDAQYLHLSSGGRVRVSADFTMRNRGTVDEHMQARFPLENPDGSGDYYGNHPQVEKFTVKVNGKSVPTTTIDAPSLPGDPLIKWAAFDMAFPVDQEVLVSVAYLIAPTADDGSPITRIHYILETGAGWYGSIGTADIILRLPYVADQFNVRFEKNYTTPGGQLVKNEVQWHWDNLKPTHADNFSVAILRPDVWQKILDLQTRLKAKPNDINMAIALAKEYKIAGSERHGFVDNAQLAEFGLQIVEQALTLHPDSADLHAELATILWWQYQPNVIDTTDLGPAIQNILKEIYAALKADPQNQQAQSLLQEMQASLGPTNFLFPTPGPSPTPGPPTASPVPSLTPVATATRVPTSTSLPVPSATPTVLPPTEALVVNPTPTAITHAQDSNNPLLLVGLAVLVVGVAGLGYARLKR
jgi:hypothetical protein